MISTQYDPSPLVGDFLWRSWSWEPLLGLILVGWLYTRGIRRLDREADSRNRGAQWQYLSFNAGLLLLFVVLVSPFAAAGNILLSAHTIQTVLLVMVAAPLILLGLSPFARASALSESWRHRNHHRRALPSQLRRLPAVWLLYAGTLAAWHLPALCEAARQNWIIYWPGIFILLGAALLFWGVVRDAGSPGGLAYPTAILFVATTMLSTSLVALLLILADTALFPHYVHHTPAWGIEPLDDQRGAGWLLLLSGMAVYLTVILWLLWSWFEQMDREERREAAGHPDESL